MTATENGGVRAVRDAGGSALQSALVVGAGLMGASAGLALGGKSVTTYLTDRDAGAVRLAADLGGGLEDPPPGPVDLAILAVPPDAVAEVLVDLQGKQAARAYTDLASTKGHVQRAAATAGADLSSFVGGHPMAGRERSGAAAARSDLFSGRPWVLCPSEQTDRDALALAVSAATLCGALPVVMGAEEHDRAVALVSHAPQLLASVMAARLEQADETALALAGTGLRDVTRVAASDPDLWQRILATNAAAVADVVAAAADELSRVAIELREAGVRGPAGGTTPSVASVPDRDSHEAPGLAATLDLLARGRRGEARLPGKHGSAHMAYAVVPVVLPDRPGQLARLFADAGVAGLNIEDVRIEHSPGQPVGLVELAVRPPVAGRLASVLADRGWTVHQVPRGTTPFSNPGQDVPRGTTPFSNPRRDVEPEPSAEAQ